MTMTTSGILSSAATHPDDYFHVISPTLSIPSDRQVAIPVGLLACQRDEILLIELSCLVTFRQAIL